MGMKFKVDTPVYVLLKNVTPQPIQLRGVIINDITKEVKITCDHPVFKGAVLKKSDYNKISVLPFL